MDRRPRLGTPHGEVGAKGAADGESRAGTQEATGRREDTQDQSTGDDRAGASGETSTQRPGERGSAQHDGGGAARTDGGIDAGGAPDADRTTSGNDPRYGERGATPGAGEGDGARQRERGCA